MGRVRGAGRRGASAPLNWSFAPDQLAAALWERLQPRPRRRADGSRPSRPSRL